jgi:uncharacterized SAM-binding protein YcdF (DUF218 family)
VAAAAEENVTRLVAVLGYSDGRTSELHRVCATRLARAEQVAGPDDVVLFSGWARRRTFAAEADLMAGAWKAPVRARVLDRHARTTLGNALSITRLARELDAGEVVLVTSSWHARRASALLRAALAGSGATLRVAAADERVTPLRGLRELASWTVVPLLALVAARTR